MTRRNGYFLKTLFFTLFAVLISTSSPVRGGQSTDVISLIELWLLDNCDLGEEGVLEKRLMGLGADAEPYLILALETGPGERLMKELEESLASRWEKRGEILRTADGTVLGKEDLDAARKVTREEYFAMEKASFVLRYRDRAILGLAHVGTVKSQGVLKKFASDKGSALKRSADDAIKSIEERLKNVNPSE